MIFNFLIRLIVKHVITEAKIELCDEVEDEVNIVFEKLANKSAIYL